MFLTFRSSTTNHSWNVIVQTKLENTFNSTRVNIKVSKNELLENESFKILKRTNLLLLFLFQERACYSRQIWESALSPFMITRGSQEKDPFYVWPPKIDDASKILRHPKWVLRVFKLPRKFYKLARGASVEISASGATSTKIMVKIPKRYMSRRFDI